MRIIVIDDDPQFYSVISKALLPNTTREMFYYSDGRRALEMIEKENFKFDHIFLDLLMPEYSGYQFLLDYAYLERKHNKVNAIPITIVSGNEKMINEIIPLKDPLGILDIIHKGEDTIAKLRGIVSGNGKVMDTTNVGTDI